MHITLIVVTVVNILFAISIFFIERQNPDQALPWLMVLVLLPWIGFFLYLPFGQHYYHDRKFQIKEEDREFFDKLVEEQKVGIVSGRYSMKVPALADYDNLVYMLLENNQAVATDNNTVKVFDDGQDKFDSLMDDIESARDYIHMEYCIIRPDELGRKLMEILTRKASEGVDERLLTDALGSRKVPKSWIRDLRDAGGRYAVLFKSTMRINFRNHRKIAVIDGRLGYVGGYNIDTEYLGKGPMGYWRDAAILSLIQPL